MIAAFLMGLYFGVALVACWYLLFEVIIDRNEHSIGQKIAEFIGFVIVFVAPPWLLIIFAVVAYVAKLACRAYYGRLTAAGR